MAWRLHGGRPDMPAGPIGSVWAEESWHDTSWQADSWADLGDVTQGVVASATIVGTNEFSVEIVGTVS